MAAAFPRGAAAKGLRLTDHLAVLVKQRVLSPGRPDRVAKQLQLLRTWGIGMAGELRQAAARSPDAVAVIDDRRGSITYAQLLERAQRVQTVLSSVGAWEGMRVGVMCRNHAMAIEVIVGASGIGADVVLLNTGLSGPQLASITEREELGVIIYDDDFAAAVSACATTKLSESELEEALATSPPSGAGPPLRSSRTIVLTSGTTGVPKGAKRPRPRGFIGLVSILSRIPLKPRETVLLSAPMFHTWGYAALQLSLALRSTMVLQRTFEPTAARTALVEHECTAMFASPVMLQRMLEADAAAGVTGTHRGGRKLRIVAVSGSALPAGLAPRFMAAYGSVLYNLYGSTEASWVAIADPADLHEEPATAGRPPNGTKVAIVDEFDRPVAPGDVGRIFVANDMIFDGYTSGAHAEQLDGMVATGDLGSVREGKLFVSGRQDDMVISGGENVYPAAVEAIIAAMPEVRECAVFGVPYDKFGHRLAAYVALREGASLDGDAIRAQVRANGARHEIPRDVAFLARLPRNATGKVPLRDLRVSHLGDN